MNDTTRRRVALACVALSSYAACADTPAEPYAGTHELEHMDYARPTSIEKPDDYAVPDPRPTRARAARGTRRADAGTVEGRGACTLDDIKRMESGGRYDAVSRTGKYRGAHQFDASTWRGAVTRAGHPEYADTPVNEVPPAVQDAAAAQLYAERGTQPWSVCR